MIWKRQRAFDLGMLILRLGFGLGFTYFHGWGKITGGPEAWARTGGAVENLGIGFGHTFFGFMAAFAEAIGGLMIAAGFLFPLASALIAATMFVAWTRHVITGQGTPAHAFKNFWVASGLFFIGPGRYSVDHWLATRRNRIEQA
jgi:putative oxidoreductase